MRRGTRGFSFLVMTLGITGLLIASATCGLASSSQAVTVTVWHIIDQNVNPSAYKWTRELLADFAEKYPNIKVEESITRNADWNMKITTAVASGLEPDIFSVRAGGWFYPFVEEAVVMPLDKYLDEAGWRSTFVEGFLNCFAYSGKTYAVPVQIRSHKMWYNKKLFEELGLNVPKTYQEFKKVITVLTENGIIPFALGNKGGWMMADWLYSGIHDRIAGPEPLKKAIERIPPGFEDPSFVKAAEIIQELVDLGAFAPGVNGVSFMEGALLFYQEQAAMNYFIDLFPDLVAANTGPDFQLDFFELPIFEGGKGNPQAIQGNIGMGLAISRRAQHPDEAAKFVQWWTAPTNIEKLTQMSGWITAIKNTVNPDTAPPLTLRVFQSLQKAPYVAFTYGDSMEASWREVFWNAVAALVAGDITAEEVAQKMEAKAVEICDQ